MLIELGAFPSWLTGPRIARKGGIWVESQPKCRDRVLSEVRRGKSPPSLLQGPAGGPMTDHPATIWAYVDTSKQVGDPENIKVLRHHGRRGKMV